MLQHSCEIKIVESAEQNVLAYVAWRLASAMFSVGAIKETAN